MTKTPRVRKAPTERREQILREATKIIGQRGYYGFSVQDVANRCGLTVAGVLHHFGTKDKLLIALLMDRDRRDEEAVSADPARRAARRLVFDDTLEPVRILLHDRVVRNGKQPEIVRLYSVLRTESLYEGHPAYGYFQDRDEWVIREIEQGLEGRIEQPRSTARQILAVMGGLEEQWLRAPEDFDLVKEWDRAIIKILPYQ